VTNARTCARRLAGDTPNIEEAREAAIRSAQDGTRAAMKDVDGTRELAIKSQRAENEQLLVSVSDTGVGLPAQQAGEIFNAFFTTKLQGTGMGLSISRSIVESHGGRLWAAGDSARGATFHIALPTRVAAN
jgi:signal transduction histidine kinase